MQEKSKSKETTPASTVQSSQEDSFDLATLKENSVVLFGVPPYVIDGALFGTEKKGLYTKSEISALILKYNSTSVS